MTQNNPKIQGKFYPLTPDVAKKLRKAKLTAAEWRFWAYLVELDPYGDRYHDLSTLSIISKLEISKATYYRAIAKFQKLGLFDFQDKGFSFKNETGVSKMRKNSQKCETSLKNEKEFSKMRQPVSKMRKTEAETVTQQDFQSSLEFKTYKTFKDSLSEGERESFLEFVDQKINELPSPPTLPNKWIEANFEELKDLWEKQTNASGSEHCEAVCSTKELYFENWEDSRHQGQYFALTNRGLAKFCENPTSKAWYEWAVVKYPHKFVDIPS